MAKEEAKKQLVGFLEQKVFDPVLNANADTYKNESEKEALKYVQDRTRAEIERYHGYGSAQKVKEMYEDDLSSENARKVNEDLQRLNLPKLADFRDEFMRKCHSLGV